MVGRVLFRRKSPGVAIEKVYFFLFPLPVSCAVVMVYQVAAMYVNDALGGRENAGWAHDKTSVKALKVSKHLRILRRCFAPQSLARILTSLCAKFSVSNHPSTSEFFVSCFSCPKPG